MAERKKIKLFDKEMQSKVPSLIDNNADSGSDSNKENERKKSRTLRDTSKKNLNQDIADLAQNELKPISSKSSFKKEPRSSKKRPESEWVLRPRENKIEKVSSKKRSTKENDDEGDGLRRSKRHRISSDSVPVYEFVPMKDDKGNQVMVQELVGSKAKYNPFSSVKVKVAERAPSEINSKINKKENENQHKLKKQDKHSIENQDLDSIKSGANYDEKTDHQQFIEQVMDTFLNSQQNQLDTKETVANEPAGEKVAEIDDELEASVNSDIHSQNSDKIESASEEENQSLYSYSKNLADQRYVAFEPGCDLVSYSDVNGIIRIDEGATMNTRRYDSDMALFIQRGTCLLCVEGLDDKTETHHSENDVIIVPKYKKYKIENLSNESKLYVFFQFF